MQARILTASMRKSSKQKLCPFNPTKGEMVARKNVFPIHLEGEMHRELSGTGFVEADLSSGELS